MNHRDGICLPPKAAPLLALRSQNRSSPPSWPRQGTPLPERTESGSPGRLTGRVFLSGGDAHPKGSSPRGTSITESKLSPKLAAAKETLPGKNRDRVTRPSRGTCLSERRGYSPQRQLLSWHFHHRIEALPKLAAARDTSPRKNRDRVTRPSTGTGSPCGKRKAACWKP